MQAYWVPLQQVKELPVCARTAKYKTCGLRVCYIHCAFQISDHNMEREWLTTDKLLGHRYGPRTRLGNWRPAGRNLKCTATQSHKLFWMIAFWCSSEIIGRGWWCETSTAVWAIVWLTQRLALLVRRNVKFWTARETSKSWPVDRWPYKDSSPVPSDLIEW